MVAFLRVSHVSSIKESRPILIEGTPTQAGAFPLTISALCYGMNVSGQSGQKEYRLVIKP
jgi:hypothetical protein